MEPYQKTPLKRPRSNGNGVYHDAVEQHRLGVHRIVGVINQAISSGQRQKTVFEANQLLFHSDQSLHDIEVEEGILFACGLQLGYILNQQQWRQQQSPIKQENEQLEKDLLAVCSTLELVLCGCSSTIRQSSFEEVGRDELLPLLLDIIDQRSIQRSQSHLDECIGCIVRILYSWSKEQSIILQLMVQYKMRFLSCLVHALSIRSCILQIHTDVLGIVKNITVHAEEYRSILLDQADLIKVLIRSANSTGRNPLSPYKAAEYGSLIIRNICGEESSVRVQIAMNSEILGALMDWLNCSHVKVRYNSITAIENLVIPLENAQGVVTFEDGTLLSRLGQCLQNDEEHAIRRRAARIFRCLGRGDALGIILMGRSSIVQRLVKAARHDSNSSVRMEAANALASFACEAQSCFVRKDQGALILKALMTISVVIDKGLNGSEEMIARALSEEAMNPQNRFVMARHSGLLYSLATLLQSASFATQEYAARALYDISCEPKNRSIMTEQVLLTALVQLLQNNVNTNPFREKVKKLAVDTVTNLAHEEVARKVMVKHSGLLATLVQYAATTQEEVTKNTVKKTIMNLVPAL